ncbi:hypothetical protein ASD15_24995 [Massilia sp. Root351]|jgi:hypothetical protein|uniref:hypothetical protein n=1 Tax=Massilia sp. Root351 TaxID=1736522 RepID=UPI000710385D|nr:hypothetical protein [Massilia sp. Root351]KQV89952.1 hypothetical protein ASD15_24995 [Massilia sp. Root351]
MSKVSSKAVAAVLFPLAAVVLAACGGSGGAAAPGGQSKPIAVGEPSPAALVVKADFVSMARAATCSELRNRLYLIDQKQVLWDRAGNCPDNADSRTLFGALPAQQLCLSGGLLSGPRTSCADDSKRAQFETMINNLDKADLGLGAGHQIEIVNVLPPDGATLGMEILRQSPYTGIDEARTVVLTDTASFEAVWNDWHRILSSIHLPPKIDFSRKMVVGILTGRQKSDCRSVTVGRVGVADGKLAVQYEQDRVDPAAQCIAQFTSPGVLVVLDRYDAPVVFSRITPQKVAFSRVQTSLNHALTGQAPSNAVVKDAASWAALWSRYSTPGAPLPAVDFSKSMVLSAYYGMAPGCDGTRLEEVARVDGQLYVTSSDTPPGPNVACHAAFTARGAMVTVDRSDEPVAFIIRQMPAPTI